MSIGAAAAPGPAAPLSAWLDWQLACHRDEIQLGLARVSAVADRLGLREAPPLTLTIGGTNGKGAATRLAADLLQRAGHRVGQFTSPHLHHYAERIVINGAQVSDATIVEAFEAIERVRGDTPLTYFEFGTLAALWLFRARGCTAQVLEVGLGGRLDAVNLLDADAALITSIGTDHRDWLGDLREQIALEKAGIYRAGRIAVCAEPDPPVGFSDVLTAFGVRAGMIGEQFAVLASGLADWQFRGPDGVVHTLPLPPKMPGGHQLRNAAGVLALLDALGDRVVLPDGAIADALRCWSLPGRFEHRGNVVLDVAHNTEAALALAALLPTLSQPVHLVLGMLADKPCEDVMAALAPQVQHVVLVDTPGPRGLSSLALAARLGSGGAAALQCQTMAAALTVARRGAGTVLVCGSFLTVVAARECLIEEEAASG